MADAQDTRKKLVQQWLKLKAAHPKLTRGVKFSADNTLSNAQYGQLLGQQSNLPHGRHLVEMDPTANSGGVAAAQTMTHELGHANEGRFIRNRQMAGEYNRLRGPAAGRGRGVLLQDENGIYRTAAVGELSATERYANDFARSLGHTRNVPNDLYSTARIHANTLALLQRRGMLPR